jgi:hypothetical protein
VVALPPQIGDQPHPIEVHIDAERRRRRVIAEPTLLARHLGKRHAGPAKLLGHRYRQIAGVLQILEILVEEAGESR